MKIIIVFLCVLWITSEAFPQNDCLNPFVISTLPYAATGLTTLESGYDYNMDPSNR